MIHTTREKSENTNNDKKDWESNCPGYPVFLPNVSFQDQSRKLGQIDIEQRQQGHRSRTLCLPLRLLRLLR